MRTRAFLTVPALVALGGCHLMLPEPSPPPPTATPRSSACTLDLGEERRSTATRLAAAGTAAPMVIAFKGGRGRDRLLRSGTRVEVRTLANGSGEATAVSAPLTILTVGSEPGLPEPIHDGDLVVLRAESGGDAPGPVRLYKVDVPNPNRPSSCDNQLRDGDFVLLQQDAPRAWLRLRGERLVVTGAPAAGSCERPRESCYTDRYGGYLCVRYPGCAAQE